MRSEYAVEQKGTKAHWSDAYPVLALARKAAKDVLRSSGAPCIVLRRIALPPGHEIGARWEKVEIVSAP